jgi:hypothetical protein
VKHVFSVIGFVVGALVMTSRSFTSHAHLSHGKELFALVAIVVVFHLIGAGIGRAIKPKTPAGPTRPGYSSGTRRF